MYKLRSDSYKLMERKPAACFEEAYPIGNGFQGAMIYGDTDNERIGLNDDTLWTGYPRSESFLGDGQASLAHAKKMILDGDYLGAEKEISANFGSYASEAYLSVGDLKISMPKTEQKVIDYRRTLDLRKALVKVRYRRAETKYSVTAFASNPDRTIVYRMESRNKNGNAEKAINFNLEFKSQLPRTKSYSQNGLLYLEGECPVTSQQNMAWTDRKTQYFDEPEKRGVCFLSIADIITDGNRRDVTNGICVENASFCEIRIFIATSFNGYDKHPYTDGLDYRQICGDLQKAVSRKDYDTLLHTHISDHSRFFDRVCLDMGSDRRANVPTSKRLLRFADGEPDKALPVLLFNFGRYLTIAASREGSQATNLQGIWNDKCTPPWQSNYTVNINTEMNYWPTLEIGLPEMYEPLLHMIQELAQTGKVTANYFYGAEGWCCHHNTDLWRHTQPVPVKGYPQCFFWNASSGWLCHHLYEYYEYTLDTKFLKDMAYPIMREAARFYLSQLVSLDGYRMILPSTSPENAFLNNGERASISETTEITMAIVRELFSNYLSVCNILNVNDDISEKVKEELPELLPIRITTDGRIMEWYREHQERDIKHRHISHLYAFYPGKYYRPDNAPEFCDACRKSLEVRGNEGTGWSLVWKANMYAALHDGNMAYYFVKKQLRNTNTTGVNMNNGGGSYANLFCAHPPFQIDGNFGVTAAIAEMLLQSDMDTVHIIPAIPSDWGNISVKGLCAKGNRKVSFTVHNGVLVECDILGSMPSKIFVADKDMTSSFIYDGRSADYIKITS